MLCTHDCRERSQRWPARRRPDRDPLPPGQARPPPRLGTGTLRTTEAAMEVMSVARRLPELPAVEKAVESGEIGFQHAAVIAESAEKLGSESLLDRQAELVEKAEAVDPARFRQEVKRVEQEVDA